MLSIAVLEVSELHASELSEVLINQSDILLIFSNIAMNMEDDDYIVGQ